MQLKHDEMAWMPQDQENYLTVLRKGSVQPLSRDQFLNLQVAMLARLVQEADEAEIQEANRRLRDNLPPSFLDSLPNGLFANDQTPRALMFNPAELESPIHEWKQEAADALKTQSATPEEAKALAESLTLESFLSRLL